ncbi:MULTISPECIES: GNAT family N-acetyltransferase [Olivibacter]|jgi:GNAT superfamily N-acetyltransferase|nr:MULTISPECIES: GNAT family N-acetyltransferase [Olivibacter]MDM8174612.1 GNAT family N-acetyltransferase [Olivibacter sp. 47]QEL01416.1 GNAT family N-acetyltransferase [Olivibacter sp. LS-1]
MLHITKAKIDDIHIIQEIAHKTWPITFGSILSFEQISYMLEMMYSTTSLLRQMTELNHHFLLAAEENECLGFISYESAYKNALQTKIHKIYILPEAQGKGVGKKLMRAVEEIALNKGDKRLLLNVNKHNEAEKFYARLGFELIGTEDIDIGSGYLMEDKIMSKKLKGDNETF